MTNDLDYTIALARQVKATGARWMLDLHYSDTWADPAKQFKPAAWARLPFPELVATLRAYTRGVLERFVRAGVTPDYVQLGNEITNGLLWPDGRVEYRENDAAAWNRLNQLLTAAYAGLDDAFPGGGRPLAVLQIESPNQPQRALWFCRRAAESGWKFDVIGVSYYPEWHGDLDTLRATLTARARAFRKPVLVVETAYPWKWDEHWDARKASLTWPVTPEGQRQFLRDVAQVVRDLPDGLGAGVVYWHPESVRVSGLHAWVGGSCALFDDQGNLLPAADFAAASAR